MDSRKDLRPIGRDTRRSGSARWQEVIIRNSPGVEQVAHGAAKAYYTEGEALALERKMQRSQGKQAGPTINIPAKVV